MNKKTCVKEKLVVYVCVRVWLVGGSIKKQCCPSIGLNVKNKKRSKSLLKYQKQS